MKKKNSISSQATNPKIQSNQREKDFYSKKEGTKLHGDDKGKVALGWKKRRWYDLGLGRKSPMVVKEIDDVAADVDGGLEERKKNDAGLMSDDGEWCGGSEEREESEWWWRLNDGGGVKLILG